MAVTKSRAEFEQQKQLARIKFSAHFNKEMRNWMMLYPAYINAKKTIATGRQLSLCECVDNPTAKEIADVLNAAGLEVMLEDRKIHPKEPFRDSIHCGRVRVLLWKGAESGQPIPISPEFPDRKSVMKLAAKSIPGLQSRQSKSKSQTASNPQSGHSGGKAAGGAQQKKGGKKGKKN